MERVYSKQYWIFASPGPRALTQTLQIEDLILDDDATPTFAPKVLLHRPSLPLNFLDSSSGQGEEDGSLLFLGRNEALSSLDEQRNPHSSILVVRCASNDRLFTIEIVRNSVYALSRLALWVTLDMLKDLKTPAAAIEKLNVDSTSTAMVELDQEWWQSPSILKSVDLTLFDKTLAIASSQGLPSISLDTSMKHCQLKAHLPSSSSPQEEVSINATEAVSKTVAENAQDVETIIENIKAQYQDALYASKVSLNPFLNNVV